MTSHPQALLQIALAARHAGHEEIAAAAGPAERGSRPTGGDQDQHNFEEITTEPRMKQVFRYRDRRPNRCDGADRRRNGKPAGDCGPCAAQLSCYVIRRWLGHLCALPAGLMRVNCSTREGRRHVALPAVVGGSSSPHGGTLFPDEIGDLPLELQPSSPRSSGGRVRAGRRPHTMSVDVRVIAQQTGTWTCHSTSPVPCRPLLTVERLPNSPATAPGASGGHSAPVRVHSPNVAGCWVSVRTEALAGDASVWGPIQWPGTSRELECRSTRLMLSHWASHGISADASTPRSPSLPSGRRREVPRPLKRFEREPILAVLRGERLASQRYGCCGHALGHEPNHL